MTEATYDADNHLLMIRMNPMPKGWHRLTRRVAPGVMIDYAVPVNDVSFDLLVVDVEVLLSGPLEVTSGDHGETRTGGAIEATRTEGPNG